MDKVDLNQKSLLGGSSGTGDTSLYRTCVAPRPPRAQLPIRQFFSLGVHLTSEERNAFTE